MCKNFSRKFSWPSVENKGDSPTIEIIKQLFVNIYNSLHAIICRLKNRCVSLKQCKNKYTDLVAFLFFLITCQFI